MPSRHGHPRWGLAVVAAFAAACNSTTAPPQAHLADPQQLSSDVQTVLGVLQSNVFESFGVVSTDTGSPAAVATPAGALLGVAPFTVPRSSSQPYADAPRRLQALRRAAGALGSGISASVIPPQYLGQTFVWDTATHRYVVGPDAGPSTGVRIILYAIDPFTGSVAEPSNTVGFVDLLDQSTTNPDVNKLHVIVKDGTPASPGPVTYADYSVSGSVTGSPATAFTASAIGFVSDGTHTLSFDATFSATNLTTDNPDAQIDVTWDLDNPVIHVVLHETVDFQRSGWLCARVMEANRHRVHTAATFVTVGNLPEGPRTRRQRLAVTQPASHHPEQHEPDPPPPVVRGNPIPALESLPRARVRPTADVPRWG